MEIETGERKRQTDCWFVVSRRLFALARRVSANSSHAKSEENEVLARFGSTRSRQMGGIARNERDCLLRSTIIILGGISHPVLAPSIHRSSTAAVNKRKFERGGSWPEGHRFGFHRGRGREEGT